MFRFRRVVYWPYHFCKLSLPTYYYLFRKWLKPQKNQLKAIRAAFFVCILVIAYLLGTLNASAQSVSEGQNPLLRVAQPITTLTEPVYASYELASIKPIPGSPEDWMTQAGIAQSDWDYVRFIVDHEGSWGGVQRYNTGGSGAYGLVQALPAGKMASAGADWATNPVTQLKWASGYALERYGSWYGAYNYWLSHHVW